MVSTVYSMGTVLLLGPVNVPVSVISTKLCFVEIS